MSAGNLLLTALLALAAAVGTSFATIWATGRRRERQHDIDIRIYGHDGTVLQMSCEEIRLAHKYGSYSVERLDGWATIDTIVSADGSLVLLQCRPVSQRGRRFR